MNYAHALGVIHRDVKPENILLQDGHALVADFGIALAVQQAGGARMTQTGLSLGTPSYMSPEQASAERTLDGRSDPYAMAAVLYEMLAGEAPFTGPSTAAIMARLITERATPLHERRASVSPALSAAVARAMEKLPADRYASCAEFLRALSSAVITPTVGRTGGDLRPLGHTGPAPGVWLQSLLPDEKRALVIVGGYSTSSGPVAVLDLSSGAISKPLLDEPLSSARLSSGFLIAERAGGPLVAYPFDGSSGKINGPGAVIAAGVNSSGAGAGLSQFEASSNRVIIFGDVSPPSLVLIDRTGRASTIVPIEDRRHNPRFSPDGRSVLVDRTTPEGRNIWLVNLTTHGLTKATTAHGTHDAIWSPDGQSFVFLTNESGVLGLRRGVPGRPESAESL